MLAHFPAAKSSFCSAKKLCHLLGYFVIVGLLLSVVLVRSMTNQLVLVWGDEEDAKPNRIDRFDCDCPITNGETELQQLARYWADQAEIQHDQSIVSLATITDANGLYKDTSNRSISIDEYTFDIKAPELFMRDDGYTIAKFLITEMFLGGATKGGATFKIIVTGPHTRNSCAFRDHFDGTYTSCCILREPENTIEFYIMNVNFMSYQMYYSHHKLIRQIRVSSLDGFTDNSLEVDDGTIWCHPEEGYWINDQKNNDIQTWKIIKNDQYTHFFDKPEIEQCFIEYNSHIVFTGDSHLRAAFGYIQSIRGTASHKIITKEMADSHPVVRAGDMTFYSSTLMPTLVGNLNIILEEAEAKVRERGISEPGLLIFNSGCHDLAHNDSALYISHFKDLIQILKKIQSTGLYHIIYQNIAPWPHFMEHNRDRHLNTFLNAATDHWINEQMTDIGVEVVDIFKLALPFEDMSVCSIHFLCHSEDHQGEHRGVVGRESTQQLIQYACE